MLHRVSRLTSFDPIWVEHIQQQIGNGSPESLWGMLPWSATHHGPSQPQQSRSHSRIDFPNSMQTFCAESALAAELKEAALSDVHAGDIDV